MTFNGMPVFFTPHAGTLKRNFSESKNRSKRIHKKLCKRFGGEFRMEPGCFVIDGKIYIHSALEKEFLYQIKKANLICA